MFLARLLLLVFVGYVDLAHAQRFAPAFHIPIGGDETTHAAVAIVDDSVVIGRTGTMQAEVRDARDGTLRQVLDCPGVATDEPDLRGCGGFLAASSKLIALGRWNGVALYRSDGTFQRRITIKGWATAVAVRGRQVLIGGQRRDRGFGPVRAYLFDGRSGRKLRTYVVPDKPGFARNASVVFSGHRVVAAAWSFGYPASVPGMVAAFDARSARLLWSRASPTLPGDQFGRSLGVVDVDIVAGPGAFRLAGDTGNVMQTYSHPLGGGPIGLLDASGELVATPSSELRGEDAFGLVHVLDAQTGQEVDRVATPVPIFESFGFAIALRDPTLVVTSDNFGGDGFIWGFRH